MKRLAKNLIFALALFSCVVVSRSFAGRIEKDRLRLLFYRLYGDRSLDGEG
jgi:hypothetical protein